MSTAKETQSLLHTSLMDGSVQQQQQPEEYNKPQGRCMSCASAVVNFEVGGWCLVGCFSLLLAWTTYLANLMLVVHVTMNLYAAGHLLWVKVTVGIFILSWAVGAALTVYHLARRDSPDQSAGQRAFRVLASLFYVHWVAECLVLTFKYKGQWQHIDRVRRELKIDLVARAITWGAAMTYLQAFLIFHLQIYDYMNVGSVTTSIIVAATAYGFQMKRSLGILTGIAVCTMWCSLGATALTFTSLCFVWGPATLNFYLVDGGLALLAFAIIYLGPLRVRSKLGCTRDLGALLVLPPVLALYRMYVPGTVWAHREVGAARYGWLVFYPTYLWRVFALTTAIIYWPLPRESPVSHMVTTWALLLWVGELIGSILITRHLAVTSTRDDAEQEWEIMMGRREDEEARDYLKASPV